MKKITLFSSSLKILTILKKIYIIKKIYLDKNEELIKKYCYRNKIDFINYSEKNIIKDKDFTELAITYGYNKIFSNKIIKKFKMGIWNIHPGNLPNYRGRHPISWALINNEKKIGISVHKINNKIDRGYLLSNTHVLRNKNDNETDIKRKMFKKIKSLLIQAERNYLKSKIKKISCGTYYRSLHKGIKVKNPSNFNFQKLFNMTKSQEIYSGIKIKNKYYKKIKMLRNKALINKDHIFLTKDNKIVKFFN